MSDAGLIVALPEESRSLGLRLGRADDPVRIGGASVLISGTGPDNARRAAERLLAAGAGGLISWGCCAALRSDLRPGALLLPERIVGSNDGVLETDPGWRQRIAVALDDANVPFDGGDLIESPTIVAGAADKRELFLLSGARAVDMESAAVARAARAANRPFLAVRAVADPAEMAVPSAVLRATNADGQVNLPCLLLALLTRPGELPALVRLGRHFGAALTTLRRVHRATGPSFLLSAP